MPFITACIRLIVCQPISRESAMVDAPFFLTFAVVLHVAFDPVSIETAGER